MVARVAQKSKPGKCKSCAGRIRARAAGSVQILNRAAFGSGNAAKQRGSGEQSRTLSIPCENLEVGLNTTPIAKGGASPSEGGRVNVRSHCG